MYKIVNAKELTTSIYLFEVEAKRVAKSCLPGQFVIVRTNEDSERIPLTISDYNREKGTITIVVQTIGAGTTMMKSLKTGDYFHDFVGPLGKASDLCYEDIDELKKKSIIFVAGGLGTAPVYPQLKWLHDHGVDADVIIGTAINEAFQNEIQITVIATGFAEKSTQGPQLSAAEYFQGKTSSTTSQSSSSNFGFPQMQPMHLDVPDFLKKN